MRTHRSKISLVDLLFAKYRRRILSLLLLHPEETFYVREIARLTATPAGSLHRELTLLANAGLLVRSTTGNQVRYQADRTCPIFEELAGILRKTVGLADVVREALEPFAEDIGLACVFGSVAQGRETIRSDVDVLVVGSISFPDIVEALVPAQERLRREINPVVMTEAEFRTKLRRGERFITRVMREPKLFLIGDAGEFGESSQNRPAQATSAERRGDRKTARGGATKSRRRRRD